MSHTKTGSLGLILLTVLQWGCTHSMRITNVEDYKLQATAERRLHLGVRNVAPREDGRLLAEAVALSLKHHPSVAAVELLGVRDPESGLDAIVTLDPRPSYEGSPWNFLITFPGFLVFTHAMTGYVYTADIDMNFEVAFPDGETVVSDVVNTKYGLRHCDFDRGFAASTGWWIPGYGVTNVLVGLVLTRYDDDATRPFVDEVSNSYGDYLANRIVESLEENRHAWPAPADAVASAGAAPPSPGSADADPGVSEPIRIEQFEAGVMGDADNGAGAAAVEED